DKALSGKLGRINQVIFNLEGLSADQLQGRGRLLQSATNSELAVIVRRLNEGTISSTDIIFKHSGGTSIIRKGTQIVEGAPLPKLVLDKLSHPGFHPPSSSGGRGGGKTGGSSIGGGTMLERGLQRFGW